MYKPQRVDKLYNDALSGPLDVLTYFKVQVKITMYLIRKRGFWMGKFLNDWKFDRKLPFRRLRTDIANISEEISWRTV